jgi:hypothetical protein
VQATTATFRQLVRQSHVIATTCDLLFPGATSDGDAIPVSVEDGQVRIDRTAQNRRSGTVTIPWSLRRAVELGVDVRTLPLGGYVLLRRGVRYADGSTELVLLGRLRVESASWDTLAESASLEVTDRMSQVRDEPFTAPYSAAGKTAAQAAVEIVQQVYGSSITYHVLYAPTDVISDAFYSGARTDALSALEQSVSAETYFDADGAFVFAQRPQASDPVVWTVDVGITGTMTSAHESLDRTGVYNGVLVEGQAQADSPPITALAVFDDPTSPIRWGGPFGKVALLAQSTSVQTPEQAAATAQDLLRLRLMQTRSLELEAAPNPALEAGDTIRVVFPDGRDEHHLIDAVTTDLGTGAQQIVTRTKAAPLALRVVHGTQAWGEL